jgi:hypothetical protein
LARRKFDFSTPDQTKRPTAFFSAARPRLGLRRLRLAHTRRLFRPRSEAAAHPRGGGRRQWQILRQLELAAAAKNRPAWRIGCNAAASDLVHFADDELIANESVGSLLADPWGNERVASLGVLPRDLPQAETTASRRQQAGATPMPEDWSVRQLG